MFSDSNIVPKGNYFVTFVIKRRHPFYLCSSILDLTIYKNQVDFVQFVIKRLKNSKHGKDMNGYIMKTVYLFATIVGGSKY